MTLVPVKRIGVNDRFGESGPVREPLAKYRLDSEVIYSQIKEFMKDQEETVI